MLWLLYGESFHRPFWQAGIFCEYLPTFCISKKCVLAFHLRPSRKICILVKLKINWHETEGNLYLLLLSRQRRSIVSTFQTLMSAITILFTFILFWFWTEFSFFRIRKNNQNCQGGVRLYLFPMIALCAFTHWSGSKKVNPTFLEGWSSRLFITVSDKFFPFVCGILTQAALFAENIHMGYGIIRAP